MKNKKEPMSIDDIEQMLIEASRISKHRKFVIAGSLCILGASTNPPSDMAMSRDLDMYPELDPGRGFVEIFNKMSEGTDFHLKNGFYIDPITPKLLSLPEGWELRTIQFTLKNHVSAMFIDPNDASVGKLARSNQNDLRWVSSGLNCGLLNAEIITSRIKTTSNLTREESARAMESLLNLCETIEDVHSKFQSQPQAP